MLDMPHELPVSEPDTVLISKLMVVKNLFLATATAVAALNLAGWLVPSLSGLFKTGWSAMSAEAAVATLLGAAGLALSRRGYGLRMRALSMGLDTVLVTGSALVFAGRLVYSTPVAGTASWIAKGMSPQAAGCFVLLGIATMLSRARRGMGMLADFCTFCLLFIVAVLVSGEIVGATRIFGSTPAFATAGQTAFCLLLLAVVVFLRRAEVGIFSILLGPGIGSKVARLLAPILIVVPYIREVMRAHLLDFRRMPPYYLTALLATTAVAFSVALLLYLAWRLNALESEIHGLSLRDPLTGLYNLRGFRILAEQALLLARRSGQPFSVLFIDVDNLKQINDGLGHQAGSELLAGTATVLREVFRETDVLGRMGGDEFAVAGQFSRSAIAETAQRLRQACMLYNADATRATLKFSAGWVTTGPEKRVPLADLLARADEEMYREKRRRKSAAARSKPPAETEPAWFPHPESSDSARLREVGKP